MGLDAEGSGHSSKLAWSQGKRRESMLWSRGVSLQALGGEWGTHCGPASSDALLVFREMGGQMPTVALATPCLALIFCLD